MRLIAFKLLLKLEKIYWMKNKMKKYYEDVINILATKIFNKITKYCEKNEVDPGKSLGIFINRLVKLSPYNIYIQKKTT